MLFLMPNQQLDMQLDVLSFDPHLRRYVSFHAHTTALVGDRSFSAVGPRVWNALPSYLRQDVNYSHFKHALKGHTFRLQSTTVHCD